MSTQPGVVSHPNSIHQAWRLHVLFRRIEKRLSSLPAPPSAVLDPSLSIDSQLTEMDSGCLNRLSLYRYPELSLRLF